MGGLGERHRQHRFRQGLLKHRHAGIQPALTDDGSPLPANTLVVVTALRSTTLIVRPTSSTSTATV